MQDPQRQFTVSELADELESDAACTGAAFEQVLTSDGGRSTAVGHEDTLAQLRRELAAVQADLAAVAARAIPEAVVCTGCNKAHVVANAHVTHCGWQWALHPTAYRSLDGDAVIWCKRCCLRVDRLIREASP